MIIWRGYGMIVPILAIVGIYGAAELEAAFGTFTASSLFYGVGAIVLWFAGRAMNRPYKPGLGRGHSFFFFAVEYWSIPLVLMYLYTLINYFIK